MKKIKFALIASLGLAAYAAQAQSFSSFSAVTSISDVSFTSLGGLSYKLQTGPAPTFTYNSNVYSITEVFGVWLMDPGSGTTSGTNQNGWSFDSSNSSGFIAGWKTNPNSGIGANTNLTFAYSTLNPIPTQVGYHVRIDGTWPIGTAGGNTGYIYANAVPEPGTMIALGFGALLLGAGALRKRKMA